MRKNVLISYEIFENQDASASFDNKSNPTNVSFLDNAGITLQWTGATINGVFKVFVSNDNVTLGDKVTNWSELDFGSSILINNSQSSHVINMNQLPFTWIAFGYERTGGTGALSCQMTVKMV